MHLARLLPLAIVVAVLETAVSAAPARADDSLNGPYFAVVDGSRTNLLSTIVSINSTCDPAGSCTGRVTTPKTWEAAITKSPGASWTITRTDPAAWTCPDGSNAAADLVYAFAPATLAGSITATKAARACGDPAMPTTTHSLVVQQCVVDPRQGMCP